ncbi:MAG: hypothetical protein ACI9X4_002203 [Glaciecola sp.]|jgi:hypothetical protein
MARMLLSFLLTVATALPALPQEDLQAPSPTADNLSAWSAYVRPRPSEVQHEQIPWLLKFGEGVQAAHDQGKPLLFWGMNGHPLGCT